MWTYPLGLLASSLCLIIKNKNPWLSISIKKSSEIILTPVSVPACWTQSRDVAHGWSNEFCRALNDRGYLCWCCRVVCVSHHIRRTILPHVRLTPLSLAWGSAPSSQAGTRHEGLSCTIAGGGLYSLLMLQKKWKIQALPFWVLLPSWSAVVRVERWNW